MARAKNPEVIQVAEHFLWSVLLTERFDHLFKELLWMPREAEFKIHEKFWEAPDEFCRVVYFEDHDQESQIRMTLHRENLKWVPLRIEFNQLKKQEDVKKYAPWDRMSGMCEIC